MKIEKVLLIEDDIGDAVLVQELMNQQKCTASITVAARFSEAQQFLMDGGYDIILADMNLPDSDGFPTIKKLLDIAPATPIIVLTGLNDDNFGMQAVQAGAQDYLVKGDIDGRILKRAIVYACERKKLEMDLKKTKDLYEQQARIDFLTGIYNRLMFSELLKAEIQRSLRYGVPISMLMFDLDHFKNVNDTYGHLVGDHVLKKTAEVVSLSIRSSDIFSRWGGEEFIVLAPGCTAKETAILAEKLRNAVENTDYGCNGLHATASFGITQFKDGDDQDSFIVRTDEAMYTSKRNGRNRVTIL